VILRLFFVSGVLSVCYLAFTAYLMIHLACCLGVERLRNSYLVQKYVLPDATELEDLENYESSR
jgi:hypothetical protein